MMSCFSDDKPAQLNQQNNEIIELVMLLSQRDEKLTRKEKKILSYEEELSKKDNEIVRLVSLLSQRDEELALSTCEIGKLKQDIDDLTIEAQFNLRKESEKCEIDKYKLEKDRQEEYNKMLEMLRKEQQVHEEQKELEELYRPFRESMKRVLIELALSTNSMCKNMFEIHTKRNEVILREINIHTIDVLFSLTNTGLYCHRPKDIQKSSMGFINCIPVYVFTEPLSLKFVKLLKKSVSSHNPNSVNYSMLDRVVPYIRDIESIIRLIPGEYKNGNWRQLDGFFGTYYNDVTNEISDLPPPFEE